jgi:GAF domain-containing protein
MPVIEPSKAELAAGEALAFLELADKALSARNLEDLADLALPLLARSTAATAAILYLEGPSFLAHHFFHHGLQPEAAPTVAQFLVGRAAQLSAHAGRQVAAIPLRPQEAIQLSLFPLRCAKESIGLLGLAIPGEGTVLLDKILPLLRHALDNILDRLELEKRNRHLNTYLTVSSMIAQALDLRDALEAVLYFSMDALAAEAASVLMLDYEKKNFRFYSAEGEAKEVLLTATFPADQGLAGSVLETQQPEIINDVQHDPRFYGKFDSESGFRTRNMIALPLTAGDEKIGVLEVLNKAGGKPFTEEDLLLLQSIAEEVAFAIRNGKMFEVVVKSYCKQRQGLNTCKGCKRPLGNWTPCVKYREASSVLE